MFRSNRTKLIAALLLSVALAVPLYYLLTVLFQLPKAASAQAAPIDALFTGHFVVIAFLFSLVVTFMLVSLVLFRRKSDDDGDGEHIHGNTALEIAWTVAPLALVIVFAIWGVRALSEVLAAPTDQEEMVVQVVGRQWSWLFTYPDQGGFTTSELVLPLNQPVRLEMVSTDVLHSFWVPEFRVKQDLLPGRHTTLRITPTLAGDYSVLCAEICGISHAYMTAPVRVVSSGSFDEWVVERQNQPDPLTLSEAERGELWYTLYGCNACHSLDGSAGAGPTWAGLYGSVRTMTDGTTVVADDAYIRESIVLPNALIVQGFAANLMQQDYADQFAEAESMVGNQYDIIEDLTAFIKALGE
jgi:cytochrome c oxidase subunit 2